MIADAALEVFAARGSHAASMDEIAERAGISKPIVYDHFASKRELLLELIETHHREFLQRMISAVAEHADQAATVRVRMGIDAVFRAIEEKPLAWQLLCLDPAADPVVAELQRGSYAEVTTAIAALLDQELPAPPGEDRNLSLEIYAEALKSAVDGLAVWWITHPKVPRHELVDRMVDLIWSGLAAFSR